MQEPPQELFRRSDMGAGDVMQISSDNSAAYEVITPDGSRVEFFVLAGQSFTVTLGSAPGKLTINRRPVDHGFGPTLVQP